MDWITESVKTIFGVLIKMVLRKHAYPPDKQEKTR